MSERSDVPPEPVMPPLLGPGPTPAPRYPDEPPDRWPRPVPPPVRSLGDDGGSGDGGVSRGPGAGGGPGGPQRALVVAAAVAVVIALVAGVAFATRDETSSRTASGQSRSSASSSSSSSGATGATDSGGSDSGASGRSTTTTTSPGDLQSVVADIKRFVEKQRGLSFTRDVPVRLAGEGEFQSLLLKDFDEEKASIEELGQVLIALDLLAPTTDVMGDMRKLLGAGVVGFYDPETGELVVRGTDTTPYVREVLAHELTHALDDQHFKLFRPELDTADDETGTGFTALVEGNARRIEDLYVNSMSAADKAKAFDEQLELLRQAPDLLTLPAILLTLLQEPYDDGPTLVKAILAGGGQARLDAAFTAPPTTSEQVLHPDKFLAGEGAAPVDLPAPDGGQSPANQGVLGALMLQQTFEDGVARAEVDAAVTGWGGDRYVTWKASSGATCLRDTMVGDTPKDTAELATAARDWALRHGATVDPPTGADTGRVTITVCH